MHIGSRFIHIRYWILLDLRDNVVCILVLFVRSTYTIGSCILNPTKMVPRLPTKYLRRPNMMVVVIYVYIGLYREPIMTVASLLVLYIQKQYDGDGYVAI